MENSIYYLILFAIVFIVKAFKIKMQRKNNPEIKYSGVLNVSLEVVYTGLGLVIAIILNISRGWIPAVFAGYALILMVSAFLEVMQEQFTNIGRGTINILIITFMIVATIYSYEKVIPKVDYSGNIDPEKIKPTPKNYTIIIPYIDHSLSNHLGNGKMIGRTFYYEYTTNALKPDSLAIIALSDIKRDTLIKPIIQKKNFNLSDIEFLTDKIRIVETSNLLKYYWR